MSGSQDLRWSPPLRCDRGILSCGAWKTKCCTLQLVVLNFNERDLGRPNQSVNNTRLTIGTNIASLRLRPLTRTEELVVFTGELNHV